MIKRFSLLLLSLSLLLASCSEYQKILKSNDYELKYKSAVEYYQKKDFSRAQALFQELRSVFKGSARGEEVNYYYSYCVYYSGDILMAAYYFSQFTTTYPLSKHASECEYMAAYCLYLYSPDPTLDQTYTQKSIDRMELFLTHYPNTPRKDTINTLVNNLDLKLQEKHYNNAYLYYKLRHYRAAVVALNNVLTDYPDTPYREKILYYILKSNYRYADNSVESKKTKRYQDTIDSYFTLINEYPKTKYLKEAKSIYTQASQFVTKK